MMEQGINSLYNPALYEVKKETAEKGIGLDKHFIFRERKSHSFYLYKGVDFQDKDHKFILMGRFFPKINEFRIYTINALTTPSMFNEDYHIAKVHFNR